jgi:hypothetical protein
MTHRRRCQALLIVCLVASQLNLLWVAERHDHGECPAVASTGVLRANIASVPPAAHHPCVVCQIVRQSAACPEAGVRTLEPSVVTGYGAAVPSAKIPSYRPRVSHGRGPPFLA